MSIISNAKEIAALVKKVGNVDLYRRIVDLEGEIIELSGENHSLKEQVTAFKQKLKLRAKLKFSDGMYWLVERDAKDGPFCQRCYDVDEKLVRVHLRIDDGYDSLTVHALPNAVRYHKCFECNAIYDEK